jgi:hypothetical protein
MQEGCRSSVVTRKSAKVVVGALKRIPVRIGEVKLIENNLAADVQPLPPPRISCLG